MLTDDFYEHIDNDKICEYDPYTQQDVELTFDDLHGELESFGYDDEDHDADHLDEAFYERLKEIKK